MRSGRRQPVHLLPGRVTYPVCTQPEREAVYRAYALVFIAHRFFFDVCFWLWKVQALSHDMFLASVGADPNCSGPGAFTLRTACLASNVATEMQASKGNKLIII
jgi:hypothetical protein